MNESNDRVREAIDAYLALQVGEPFPALDHLSEEERREVEDYIDFAKNSREIEPSLSEPSLQSLLHGSEFAGALASNRPGDASSAVEKVTDQIVLAVQDCGVNVVEEPELTLANFWRYRVLRANGHRVGVLVLTHLQNRHDLDSHETLKIAGERLGAAPDLAAVLIAVADLDLTAVAIDQQDVTMCIDAPSGDLQLPSIRRQWLPLAQAIHSIFDEVSPVFSDLNEIRIRGSVNESKEIIRKSSQHAVERIASQGRSARVPAKKLVWAAFGEDEVAEIETILRDARLQSLKLEELRERISDSSEAA